MEPWTILEMTSPRLEHSCPMRTQNVRPVRKLLNHLRAVSLIPIFTYAQIIEW